MPDLTEFRFRGLVVGAFVLTIFGMLWSTLAVAYWKAHPRWSVPACCIVTVLLLVGCARRFTSIARMPKARREFAGPDPRRLRTQFNIIFSMQWAAIGISSWVLLHTGHSTWIPVCTAVIVGLHFLPLARTCALPLYYWTGAGCVAGVSVCLWLDPARRVLCVGLVMAAVLWATAAVMLLQSRPEEISV